MHATRPQDLVFTLFGEYLLHRRGPVWVGSLISLLEAFDLSEGAVRTVLSRMARKGWLFTTRRGRLSFYDLTSRGRRLLEEGAERIHHPPWDRPWNGRWLLVAYSIPERRRADRDRLRDRLAWLGFGSLGNGLWISPHDVEQEVAEVASALGISHQVEVFRADRLPERSDPADLVTRCWDLASINARYEAFISRWVPTHQRCRAETVSPRESYALRFRLIHEYREFPLLDPYLPRELQPRDWGGECAAHLFKTLHDLLVGPADAHVDAVLADAPASAPLRPRRTAGAIETS